MAGEGIDRSESGPGNVGAMVSDRGNYTRPHAALYTRSLVLINLCVSDWVFVIIQTRIKIAIHSLVYLESKQDSFNICAPNSLSPWFHGPLMALLNNLKGQ